MSGQVNVAKILGDAQADYYGRARTETNPSAADHWCAQARKVYDAGDVVTDLVEASADLRKWTNAICDFWGGAWHLRDEDAGYNYFEGGRHRPQSYTGDFQHGTPDGEFASEEAAKFELTRQRSFAIARVDAVLARVGGGK